ncbi:MAG: DUF4224 domain-containing protein [Gammaproteobacteria bacterium]|nr:DUF4224 domain-containing protein [Gammaproteobacteria bacterium]
MSALFLSPKEVEELTGYTTPSKQSEWLLESKYLHEVGADGKPKVLRAHLMARLGGMVEPVAREPRLRLT